MKNYLKGIKVQNMESSRGNDVPNQFIINTPDATIFQSYWSVIAVKTNGTVYLDENKWDYSRTTGKYRNQFLNENRAETHRKIDNGVYKLVNLNS
jgi:hypothetical protein